MLGNPRPQLWQAKTDGIAKRVGCACPTKMNRDARKIEVMGELCRSENPVKKAIVITMNKERYLFLTFWFAL